MFFPYGSYSFHLFLYLLYKIQSAALFLTRSRLLNFRPGPLVYSKAATGTCTPSHDLPPLASHRHCGSSLPLSSCHGLHVPLCLSPSSSSSPLLPLVPTCILASPVHLANVFLLLLPQTPPSLSHAVPSPLTLHSHPRSI